MFANVPNTHGVKTPSRISLWVIINQPLPMTIKSSASYHYNPSSKKLVYLSRYLTRRERLDEMELGMQEAGTGVSMATLEVIKPHRIALKLRVNPESLRAHMCSQYLCGTEIPDYEHIIYEVKIWDRHGEVKRVWALIDCGAMSIPTAPRPLQKLGSSHKAAQPTTLCLIRQVIEHARHTGKRQFRLIMSTISHWLMNRRC